MNRTTVMSALLFAVVLACIPATKADDAAPAAANLLINGSFETVDSANADQAAHWNRWGQWINREDSWTPVHDGKAIIGYHHWQIDSADDSGMWRDVTVTPGEKYEFSIFVNRDKPADGQEADSVEIRLETVLADHQETINSQTAKVSDLETGEKWSKLTVSGVASGKTLRVLLRVVPAKSTPRNGSMKFDDAALVVYAKK